MPSRSRGKGRGNNKAAPLIKKCSTCGLRQSVKHFFRRKQSIDGYRGQCKRCLGKNGKDTSEREGYLRRTYGITLAHYDLLLAKQNGVCAICHGLNDSGMRLAVDHCHATKQLRGLLCNSCNRALGYFDDDVSLLKNGISYLEGSNALIANMG